MQIDPQITEVKPGLNLERCIIDSEPKYRYSDWPKGVWAPEHITPIEKLMFAIGKKLGMPNAKVSTVGAVLGIEAGALSKVKIQHQREGRSDIPLGWFVKIYDVAAIPIDEQREIAGIPRALPRHESLSPAPELVYHLPPRNPAYKV